MSQNKKPKAPVCCDEVKLRHTTHWDWEMASHQELEEAYAQGARRLRLSRLKQALMVFGLVFAAAVSAWGLAEAWGLLQG